MPIEVGIWRMGDKLERIGFTPVDLESKLEDMLAQDVSILSPSQRLMLVGRQIPTDYGKFIDLLAMDVDGNLAVIELKRDRTPREVVAQLLDYASWVQSLTYERIAEIYADKNDGKELEKGFADAFESSPPEELNLSHQLIVVATELDSSTERIIDYLSENYEVPINAVFFRHFRDGENEYLTRSWLIDPTEPEAAVRKAGTKKGQEPWNGRDFYVNVGTSSGEDEHRNWDDFRKYGFVSAGQSEWASVPLKNLKVGARIFAMFPGAGYVGVGIVNRESTPVREFRVEVDGREVPVLEAPLKATLMADNADNLELCEHLIAVEWIKQTPRKNAYWEKGMFANQVTVCRLRNRFTLERLIQHFELED